MSGDLKAHRKLFPLVALWFALMGGGLWWLSTFSVLELRERLKVHQVLALDLLLLVVVLLSVANLPRLWAGLQVGRRDLRQLAWVSLLALVLVVVVAPRTNRILYDEQIYMSVGQNISDERRAQMCVSGHTEYGILDCQIGEYNKQPYAYPHLLSTLNRAFGVHETTAYVFNNLAFVATLWVLFLISMLLFGDRSSALFGALLAATIPIHVTWSNTAASEPSAALFVAVGVLATIWYCRNPSFRSAAWAVATVLLASQFRPESILILPLFMLTLFLMAPRELISTRLWWAGLAAIPLALVFAGHLMAVSHESWGAGDGPRFSSIYFYENFRLNGQFYLLNRGFPALYTAWAAAGLTWALVGEVRRKKALLLLLWFAAFWSIFLFFYAGSYAYGADVRYSLMSYVPLALLGGLGCAVTQRWLVARLGTPARWIVPGLVALTLLSFLPLIRAVGEEAWGAREDVAAARRFAEQLPANSTVLTHNPNMFLIWGRNASQIFVVLDHPEHLDFLRKRFAGGVFFHWNYWCNTQNEVQVGICQRFAERYDLRLVAEERERDYRYALYEVAGEQESEDVE